MSKSTSPPTSPSPRRGAIHWVDWTPGRGSEQTGLRPALVVQSNAGNRSPRYPNTIVVAISRSGRNEILTHVRLEPSPENGLKTTSYARCEQLFTISKDRLQGLPLGRLSRDDMARVDDAIKKALELA